LLDPNLSGSNTVPTAYNQEGLIISASQARTALQAADELGRILGRDYKIDGPSWLRDGRAASNVAVFTTGVKLTTAGGQPGGPDPWAVLTKLRSHPDRSVAMAVSLNHVLSTAEQFGGNPLAIGHGRVGLDSYGIPGVGGRGPVSFVGSPPRRRPGAKPSRVVVLDTAVGEHPWFDVEPPMVTFQMTDGTMVGDEIHPYPRDDGVAAAVNGIPNPLSGTVGTHSGHGLFIAGLIRQACPGAEIVSPPIMGSDGVVPEHMLIRALDLVLKKQIDQPGWADALVLSLGYYNETREDLDYTSGLKELLLALGRRGVAVFAAAGNDATDRESYPAAFAADAQFDELDVLPLTSVGAVYPDGTPAEFTNHGEWVTSAALGVNVVSCAPMGLNGSGLSTAQQGLASQGGAVQGRAVQGRALLDPDNFRSGFAAWSGTSFATPLLAGRYLNTISGADFPDSFTERRKLLRRMRRPVLPPVSQIRE
jgi:hypothetical protein